MPKIGTMKSANQIIDDLGGTSAVAELCECRPASVSDWRKNGIPKARLLYLKAIRPEVFNAETELLEKAAA